MTKLLNKILKKEIYNKPYLLTIQQITSEIIRSLKFSNNFRFTGVLIWLFRNLVSLWEKKIGFNETYRQSPKIKGKNCDIKGGPF